MSNPINETTPIRRTRYGAIDTAYYLARGRRMRSDSAWRMFSGETQAALAGKPSHGKHGGACRA